MVAGWCEDGRVGATRDVVPLIVALAGLSARAPIPTLGPDDACQKRQTGGGGSHDYPFPDSHRSVAAALRLAPHGNSEPATFANSEASPTAQLWASSAT